MKCVFIAFLGESGSRLEGAASLRNCVAAAVQWSGCDVVVISDAPDVSFRGAEVLPVSRFSRHLDRLRSELPAVTYAPNSAWRVFSIYRWLVLLDFAESNSVAGGIWCLDWDVMVFQALADVAADIAECDVAVARVFGIYATAYFVREALPLKRYQEWVKQKLNGGRIIGAGDTDINDMSLWSSVAGDGSCKVEVVNKIRRGRYCDPNIAIAVVGDGLDEFEKDGRGKRIFWRDGHPFFRLLPTGENVLANWIHCWGPYKDQTGILLDRAKQGFTGC